MSKKVSYTQLLKEAIQGTDTSDTVDVKGPMLDPILSYKGGGELPTNKDAASILERYYFGEKEDKGVTVADDEEAVEESGKGPIDNDIDEVPAAVAKTKKDIEKEVTTEADEEEEEDEKEEVKEADEEEKEADEEEVKEADEEEKEADEEEVSETDQLENAIIEKLIEEMEEEIAEADEEEDEKEEVEEAKNMDPDPGNEPAGKMKGAPENKVPSRKDITKEASETDEEDDEKEEEKDLDVDKEVKKESDAGVGPGPIKAQGAMGKDGEGENDEVEEAFAIFKEQILEEEDEKDVPEVDSDNVVV